MSICDMCKSAEIGFVNEPCKSCGDYEKFEFDSERFESVIRAYERAKAINEIFDKSYDVDMDSSFIYIRFDKDNFDVPFMTQKTQLKEWFKEQLKEQNNGRVFT